jgi:hypothetical protein
MFTGGNQPNVAPFQMPIPAVPPLPDAIPAIVESAHPEQNSNGAGVVQPNSDQLPAGYNFYFSIYLSTVSSQTLS